MTTLLLALLSSPVWTATVKDRTGTTQAQTYVMDAAHVAKVPAGSFPGFQLPELGKRCGIGAGATLKGAFVVCEGFLVTADCPNPINVLVADRWTVELTCKEGSK